MKKGLLLNSALSEVIATLGHGDMLVLGDAGLPIPPGPRRIDLAVCPGTPALLTVLQAVLSEMHVERATIASELITNSPSLASDCAKLLNLTPSQVTHEAFKRLNLEAKAMVRTGECTPYANIILYAGVVFNLKSSSSTPLEAF